MYGVNVVLLDMIYLRENWEKIKGMVVIYGYEDYIGGIVYYFKQFDIFIIYGFWLVMVLLWDKLEEVGMLECINLQIVFFWEMVCLGKFFVVEFICNIYFIVDSYCLVIYIFLGVVMYSGDFKIDYIFIDGEFFDL